MLHLAGDHRILVYPKPDHRPASFTVLNFPVDDIDQAVDELSARGVPTLRYGASPPMTRDLPQPGRLIAWFTDPAGNVLSVVQERVSRSVLPTTRRRHGPKAVAPGHYSR
jgi:hypothetical protein